MPDRVEKQPAGGPGALTAGCLLLLVLVADAAAGLLVLIVCAVRGLDRGNVHSGQTVSGAPPADWLPVLGVGTLALALCATGILLLRLGHRGIAAVQLTLSLVLACQALG